MIRKNSIFYFVVTFTFLIGGILQLAGIISNTSATLVLSFILFWLGFSEKKWISINWLPYLFLGGLIIASGLINNVSPFLTTLYFFDFLVVPLAICLYIGNQVIFRVNRKKIFSFLLFIGIIQLPVIILQHIFSNEIVGMSARHLSLEDVAFGTFFFANDHGLGFFLNGLIIYLLFDKSELSVKRKMFYIVWFCITIILMNSNISILLLLCILASNFFKFSLSKSLVILASLLMLFLIIFTIPTLFSFVGHKYGFINHLLTDNNTTFFDAEANVQRGIPTRIDVLLYFMGTPFQIIGHGPYNYFDPIKGDFRMFQNFSQYLWFYNDLGILGLFSVFFYYIAFYFKYCKLKDFRILYLLCILVYSFFFNTLSDLAFNILFCFFILKDSKQLSK